MRKSHRGLTQVPLCCAATKRWLWGSAVTSLVWGVGVGGGLLLHPPRRKPKNLLHPVHKAFLTHGGGIWCCRELTVIHGDWVSSHLGMSSTQTPLWFLSLEFCVLLPDWFSTQTLIDHSTRVEREDWINPSKASLDRRDVAWSKEVIFPGHLCGLLVTEGQRFLTLDSFCMAPGHCEGKQPGFPNTSCLIFWLQCLRVHLCVCMCMHASLLESTHACMHVEARGWWQVSKFAVSILYIEAESLS